MRSSLWDSYFDDEAESERAAFRALKDSLLVLVFTNLCSNEKYFSPKLTPFEEKGKVTRQS